MLVLVAAFASSLCWGGADFLGGLYSRRLPLLVVVFVSQAAALGLVLLWLAARANPAPPTADLLWGASAGLVGLCGLLFFYRALEIGTMSVVAPIAATGTVLPVLVGVTSGEAPTALQFAGIAIAAVGVVVASRSEVEAVIGDTSNKNGVLLAAASAFGFGGFFVLFAKASEHDIVWALTSARVPGIVVITALTWIYLTRRADSATQPKIASAWPALLAIGMLDLAANVLFALASQEGLLSVVSVLSSLFPAVTVVLARMFLNERLARLQQAGVVATIVGVALIASGSG